MISSRFKEEDVGEENEQDKSSTDEKAASFHDLLLSSQTSGVSRFRFNEEKEWDEDALINDSSKSTVFPTFDINLECRQLIFP